MSPKACLFIIQNLEQFRRFLFRVSSLLQNMLRRMSILPGSTYPTSTIKQCGIDYSFATKRDNDGMTFVVLHIMQYIYGHDICHRCTCWCPGQQVLNTLFDIYSCIFSMALQWRYYAHSAMASLIAGFSIVCSNVCSSADQIKHQSFTSLAFVRGIHQ